MAEPLNKPRNLTFGKNQAEEWKSFERGYDNYIDSLYSENTNKSKAAILLNLAGEKAMKLAENFTYLPELKNEAGTAVVRAAESKHDPEVLKAKFKLLCEPKLNVIMERHAFNTRDQLLVKNELTGKDEDEDIRTWVSDLKTLASTCEYGDLKDDLIRDRIVVGLRKNVIRMQLMKESSKLTLERAVEICLLHEQSKKHIASIKPEKQSSSEVDALRLKHKS